MPLAGDMVWVVFDTNGFYQPDFAVLLQGKWT
jgi:hypothetical protein